MITRAATFFNRIVFPISRVVSSIGLFILALIAIMVVASIISRRLFGTPIAGVYELTSLGLVLVVFLTLGYCAASDGHIILDIVVFRLRKRPRAIIGVIINMLNTAILGVASWQLWVQAVRVQKMSQTSGVLAIPIYPFVYVAALGGFLITVVYLIKVLNSLSEAIE